MTLLQIATTTMPRGVADPLEIADFYCGAGGSTSGLVRAANEMGVPFSLTGVNHWDRALNSNAINHPYARHFKMEVEDVPADVIFPRRRLDIMWASPECTEHSYAKGGKSINDQRRANAWSIPRLANELRPSIIIVENVQPFVKWGPIEPARHRNGRVKRDRRGEVIYRPIESRKGETFREWFAAVEACGPGYTGEWRLLNAADYGEAQSRTRFIAVFTAPGVHYEWPKPTHSRIGDGLPKWVGAGTILNLDLPMESIFDRGKPLSDNTIERIAAGVPLVVDSPELTAVFQVILRRNADIVKLENVAPALCASGTHHAVAKVSLAPIICRNQTHNAPTTGASPAPCLTTAHGGGVFVATPNVFVLGQHGGSVPRTVDEPISTIATDGYVRIFAPYLVKVTGTINSRETPRSRVRTSDKPLGALTQKNGMGIAELRVNVLGKAPGSGVIVDIDGTLYLFDCRFRMLDTSELLQFQGLSPNYVLDGTKGEQTAQIGNAVSEKLAHALGRQAYLALGYAGGVAQVAA
jgi:DNA (cytosine-5)-methyltransferase 1